MHGQEKDHQTGISSAGQPYAVSARGTGGELGRGQLGGRTHGAGQHLGYHDLQSNRFLRICNNIHRLLFLSWSSILLALLSLLYQSRISEVLYSCHIAAREQFRHDSPRLRN
jgi:hypothetical protein